MKQIGRNVLASFAVVALASVGFVGQAFAQQKTVEHKQTGPDIITVDTRHTTVAYIEGNHLVVRLADGSLEAIRIPPEERFNIEGQKLTLHELKPGMTLTDETFTTEKPMMVKTVEITEGKVFHATSRRLIIHTKEGEAVDYKIPEWATVTINGEEKPLHELRRGQTITATITIEEPMTVIDREKRSHGHPLVTESKAKTEVPVPAKTEVTQAKPPAEPQPTTTATEVEEKLPATASNVPLIGLTGIFALVIAVALKAFQKG
jgi:hypothetical protein